MRLRAEYRGRRLDGSLAEFHRAVDLLRWDTVPEAVYQAMQQQTQGRRGRPARAACSRR